MKPNKQSDPLDQKIDALLSSRPLQPSEDFAQRVLAAAEADDTQTRSSERPSGILLKFALPIAAAIALTFSFIQLKPGVTEPTEPAALSSAEAQEIFLLEESLSGLSAIAINEFGSGDLLATLDALYLEI